MLMFTDEGSGDPLLLVHAGIADSRMWQPQVDRFCGERRVICPDLRGYGRTSHNDRPYRHAEDLAELLDELRLHGVVVVGASMGGAASIDLALNRPDLVRALVLVGSVYDGFRFTDEDLFAQWRVLAETYAAGDLDKAASIEADIWLDSDTAPEVRRQVAEMLRLSYEHGEIDQTDVAVPAGDRLSTLDMPVLVVVGDKDRTDIQRAASELTNSFSDARLVTIPGTTHLPSLEQPSIFNDLLTDLLTHIN
jgi:pimeloyl-ACP methyl ester carboxylesterase